MDISQITSPAASSDYASGSSSSSTGISTDDFYKLLAAEMQYQDPMEGDDDSGGSSDSSDSYVTELAILSATSAIQDMTGVENYSMASGVLGTNVSYTSESIDSSGKATDTTKTGTIEAADFTSGSPRFYVASTDSSGTTSGEWIDPSTIQQMYASNVTGVSGADSSSSSSASTSGSSST